MHRAPWMGSRSPLPQLSPRLSRREAALRTLCLSPALMTVLSFLLTHPLRPALIQPAQPNLNGDLESMQSALRHPKAKYPQACRYCSTWRSEGSHFRQR